MSYQKYSIINSMRLYIAGIVVILFCVVFLIFTVYKQKNIPTLVSVNVTQIIQQFIQQELKKNLPSDVLKKEVDEFSRSLDMELKKFAKEKNVSLLLHEAVVANVNDYTEMIKTRLKKEK